jgi:hypothetical protein
MDQSQPREIFGKTSEPQASNITSLRVAHYGNHNAHITAVELLENLVATITDAEGISEVFNDIL